MYRFIGVAAVVLIIAIAVSTRSFMQSGGGTGNESKLSYSKAQADHGKAVLAIGEARPHIVRALAEVVPVLECASLREAVEQARSRAAAGDTVLLAPACSSFDMFRDYAHRGRAFKEEVGRLQDPRVGRG